MTESPHILVLGIGNLWRGDDAAGRHAARRLAERISSHNVAVREVEGEGAAVMEALEGFDAAILVDAVESGASPGTVHCWDVSTESMNAKFLRCSTHNFSVHDAVEMARALGKLPPRVIVFGIEGKTFSPGQGMAVEVETSMDSLVSRVLEQIHTLTGETRHA
ncbi:putative Hydrogenase maturation protease HycI [Nitrospina gracilis 3/211]|uniref:Putative Hydrogenase maturation protease HycI n=1 Tax=Nitrospina gracilis (strain 3/211) TaxID=1266370 RepID=M1YHJ6_NITG3|nr:MULTISPECIES: hydrogenase maturation protease [Nitrospina]MCF8722985.1 hydrogenase maturation protease [Nitrospina sp. Nb-3]CCQ89955.1 putative Hydrogenase maturation protease HycI [Nitrospina gracilis 3/211]